MSKTEQTRLQIFLGSGLVQRRIFRGIILMKGRAMDDRARLDERHFALRQHLEALASQVSELEILRGQVAKAERRIFGAARETRKAVYEESSWPGQHVII